MEVKLKVRIVKETRRNDTIRFSTEFSDEFSFKKMRRIWKPFFAQKSFLQYETVFVDTFEKANKSCMHFLLVYFEIKRKEYINYKFIKE